MHPQHHIVIIGMVWPEPNSTAAGNRMLQLISAIKSFNYKITFVSAASDSEFMYDVTNDGIEKMAIKLNDASFDDLLKQLNPTIVMFDRYITEEQYGWRISENCPHALRILDTEDLHCLRLAREKACKEKRMFESDDLLSDVAKREIASIYRCDLSLIISTYEMNLLQQYFKIENSLLLYLPFMLDELTESETQQLPIFENRNHFLSIGNFLHEPNWNATLFLKEEIWPLIRKKLPSAEMHVYGAYPSQKVFQLHDTKSGFIIKGRAENAHDVMKQAKVCLAPLRFGAGLKGKLIDAMQCGTPTVTTEIGAEGMDQELPWCGEIKNTPQAIADAAVNLFITKNKWEMAQQNGFSIINTLFQKNNFIVKLKDKIENTLNQLDKHRNSNFIGAMLQHHTTQSTKYLSRWIELKNR